MRQRAGPFAWVVALLEILTIAGCEHHGETSLQIIEAHAASYAACEQLRLDLTENIEQQKRAIENRMSQSGEPAAPVNLAATREILDELTRCWSDWDTKVMRDLTAAGISQSRAQTAIADWRENRRTPRETVTEPR